MDTKTFEIRDRGTFIPAIAVRLNPVIEEDRYLISRAGFGTSSIAQGEHVMLAKLAGGVQSAKTDPYEWGNSARTMGVAHNYILKTPWHQLESGQVIDVEHILGETPFPKISERLEEIIDEKDAAMRAEIDMELSQDAGASAPAPVGGAESPNEEVGGEG